MTALYKVHTVYRKEDVVKMQKLVGQRFQRTYRCRSRRGRVCFCWLFVHLVSGTGGAKGSEGSGHVL